MTNNIYTIQEEKHLIKELKELINKYTRINQIIQRKENKHLLDFINFKTPLLNDPIYNNVTRIYWVIHNLIDFPKCDNPNCNNLVGIGINVKLSENHGYNNCCSKKCAADNPNRRRKISQTSMKKYGVSWPSKLDRVKNKMKQTNLKKYGTICPLQNEAIQNKSQQTNLEKFGVPIANQFNSTNEILKKYEDNCLEIYGTDHPWKNEEVLEKRKNTWIEKYGVDNPTKNPDIINQISDSVFSKYGVINVFALKEVKNKIKETNIEKYGVENVFQSKEIKEKIKETNLEKYGYEVPSQSKEVQKRMQQTCLKKYGVPFYFQSKESAKFRRTVHEFDGIFFDSKPELDFYKNCLAHSLKIKRSDKRFQYIVDNKAFYYFPDFEIDDKIIEVKGNHFFRIIDDVEEMFCPFRNKDMSDEIYKHLCNIYNAKYHCMLDNNVMIIKSSKVKDFDYSLFK